MLLKISPCVRRLRNDLELDVILLFEGEDCKDLEEGDIQVEIFLLSFELEALDNVLEATQVVSTTQG